MRTSEKIGQIAEAICKIQEELPAIKKTKQGYGYKYAPLSTINEIITPICCKHKVAIIQSVGTEDDLVRVTTRLQHATGEFFEDHLLLSPTGMKSKKGEDVLTAPQEMGVSITYGRRYAISAMLNIATEEDTDGVYGQEKAGKPETKPPQAKSKGEKEKSKTYLVISGRQGKRLLAIAGENGWSRDDVKAFILATYKLEHLRDITPEIYDDVVSQFSKPKEAKS